MARCEFIWDPATATSELKSAVTPSSGKLRSIDPLPRNRLSSSICWAAVAKLDFFSKVAFLDAEPRTFDLWPPLVMLDVLSLMPESLSVGPGLLRLTRFPLMIFLVTLSC